jgi:hypothetical protein
MFQAMAAIFPQLHVLHARGGRGQPQQEKGASPAYGET